MIPPPNPAPVEIEIRFPGHFPVTAARVIEKRSVHTADAPLFFFIFQAFSCSQSI